MRLLMRWNVVWLVAAFMVASIAMPHASATQNRAPLPNRGALKQRLRTVNRKINVVQKQLAQKKKEQHKVKVELAATEVRLNDTQSRLDQNKSQLAVSQRKLKAITQRLAETQKKLERRSRLLSGRLVNIYEGDDIGYVDVLLGSQDMKAFLSRGHYVKKIVSSDVNLIEQIKKDREQVERDKRAQAAEVTRISSLQASLIRDRDAVESLKNEKQDDLESIEHDRALYERALADLMQKSQEIEDSIRRYQSTPQGIKRFRQRFVGGLGLPVNGRVTCRFGYRIHPITRVHSLHTGVDIACPSGTPIHAAAGGDVILAGWMGAYGNAVVIDHGGGVQTLYGHNSRLLVHVGQSVSKGQVIAHSGSTGWSTGPHCHFEKRVNGRPVNPL